MTGSTPENATTAATSSQAEKVQTMLPRLGTKVSVADLFAALNQSLPSKVGALSLAPPKSSPLTEEQRHALKALPLIFGSVSPEENRMLTQEEAQTLVEERAIIDTLLGPLKKRKDEAIREILANHADHVYLDGLSEEERQSLPIDSKGHVQIKRDVPLEKTGKKVQVIVAEGKPSLTIEAVTKAHEDGLIDRATYLAITSKPDLPRVLDENKMAQAIKKDPSLLFALADLTTPGSRTTTIKVEDDK